MVLCFFLCKKFLILIEVLIRERFDSLLGGSIDYCLILFDKSWFDINMLLMVFVLFEFKKVK